MNLKRLALAQNKKIGEEGRLAIHWHLTQCASFTEFLCVIEDMEDMGERKNEPHNQLFNLTGQKLPNEPPKEPEEQK